MTDPLRLKQILLNLCSNAIKFTDVGSVNIFLKYNVDQDILTCTIKDTGIGMTYKQIQKLFRPFKQADTSISRRFGGTGLGLFLAKKLSELLNSELTAESTPGYGSAFTLNILESQAGISTTRFVESIEEFSLLTDDRQKITTTGSLSGEVLVVEDNHMNQRLIQTFLERMGASVTIAENGAVAVNLAEQYPYDLIYMDMQMPVMSGLSALETLRSKDYSGPVVMLTANATSEDRKRCEEAGSNDYLTKPIFRDKLYEMTKRYLRSSE
jgi:CheY-like chemotaxis protein